MECWHLSGAGNDFAVVDMRGRTMDLQSLAMQLCQQLGADGFLALDDSETADIRMHFYNPDGLRGEMCGNGIRCLCRFAWEKGVVGEHIRVQTDAGLVTVDRLNDSDYRVALNLPSVVKLRCKDEISYVELGDPGIPHAVIPVPGLEFTDREKLRPLALSLRDDPVFLKGVNMNFYTRLNDDTVRVLTFERGVEDYTLACGTGCGSLAVTLWLQGQLPGGTLTAENQGGILRLTVAGTDKTVEKLILEGPTEILKKFEI